MEVHLKYFIIVHHPGLVLCVSTSLNMRPHPHSAISFERLSKDGLSFVLDGGWWAWEVEEISHSPTHPSFGGSS
jgi:hypothetical protein